MTPTIEQVMSCYREIARAERMKCGRPGLLTAKNAVRGATIVCAAADIPLDASVARLTRKAIDGALVRFLDRGIARISAWSYVCQLRAVFAKWTRPYYEDRGWELPKLELPSFRAQSPRYMRPTPDLLRGVKAWYERLERETFGKGGSDRRSDREPEREWLAVTLMLEFAVRNGDVLRLTPDNFIVRTVKSDRRGCAVQGAPRSAADAMHFLSYTPHKTELSSGRRVCWPIHPEIWARFEPLVTDGDRPGSALLRTLDTEIFGRINRQMRTLGFHGGKGAYELRKICIDHVYQNFGAEKATAISGDDIKTVTRYYADAAAATVVGTRVLDLL